MPGFEKWDANGNHIYEEFNPTPMLNPRDDNDSHSKILMITDQDDMIFYADVWKTICKVDPSDGTLLAQGSEIADIESLCVDPDGRLFCCRKNDILEIDKSSCESKGVFMDYTDCDKGMGVCMPGEFTITHG